MRDLIWSSSFTRAIRKFGKRRPELKEKLRSILTLLKTDPFHPQLRTHKLHGELAGAWACSVEQDVRIVFNFVSDSESIEEAILLIDIGTHEEVY
ncbi:MAG: type II toxin-antitoxin system YafQ family toxin [Desulfomonilaceae bacterium]